MSNTYTVKAAAVTKTEVGKYKNDEVTATLANADGKEAEVTFLKKPDSPLPEVGSTLDGTVEQTQYGLRFKREWKGQGGGGNDRSRDAEIALAVAVKSATALAQSFIESGQIKDDKAAIAAVSKMTPKLLPIVTGTEKAEPEGKASAPKTDDDIPF